MMAAVMLPSLLHLSALLAPPALWPAPAVQHAAAALAPARLSSAVRMSAGDGDSWSEHDDHLLRDHINSRTGNSARLGPPRVVLQDLSAAWVLIFNVGKANEGVYTLQGRAKKSSAYVLAFEQTEDADRFASQLSAEGFDLATPLCWEANQLEAFCAAGEFELSLVTDGTLITPPTKNEYDVDAFERLSYERSSPEAGHKTLDLRQGGSAEGTPQQQMGGARREQQDKYRLERDALERLWQSGKGEDEGGLGDDRRPS